MWWSESNNPWASVALPILFSDTPFQQVLCQQPGIYRRNLIPQGEHVVFVVWDGEECIIPQLILLPKAGTLSSFFTFDRFVFYEIKECQKKVFLMSQKHSVQARWLDTSNTLKTLMLEVESALFDFPTVRA